MKTITYKIRMCLDDKGNLVKPYLKAVEGYQHSKHLAVRRVEGWKDLWAVDHLPTGLLIQHGDTRAKANELADFAVKHMPKIASKNHKEAIDGVPFDFKKDLRAMAGRP